MLDGTTFDRDGNGMLNDGLYVERPGWGIHLLRVT
jgi:hypothetical protein